MRHTELDGRVRGIERRASSSCCEWILRTKPAWSLSPRQDDGWIGGGGRWWGALVVVWILVPLCLSMSDDDCRMLDGRTNENESCE